MKSAYTFVKPSEKDEMSTALRNIGLHHVELYVTDAEAHAAQLVDIYGFRVLATGRASDHRTIAVVQGDILLLLTEGTGNHPASTYSQTHGDGVADIALTTPDARDVFDRAVAAGATPVAEPVERDGDVVATVSAFCDVTHTLIQRSVGGGAAWFPADLAAVTGSTAEDDESGTGLRTIDHLAVCVEAGRLQETVDFYVQGLGFSQVYEERIVVSRQAMNSKVVRSWSGEILLTIIEPDTSCEAGQIDHFVKEHGGAGVQHIAFATADIVRSVGGLRDRGAGFLSVPAAYYTQLLKRIEVTAHAVDELRELNILVDSDHAGQLFQIFTRSTHPRRTFFFEVIERLGAETFGSGNIKALYEAVELECAKGSA